MEYVRLGDICTKVCSGGTPTSSNPAYYDGDIPWLNTNEVNFCNIYSTNKTISEEGLRKSAAKYVPANTVIVAMYGVTAGKCAIAKIPLTTNQACCNLVINDKLADYRYVYHFLYQQSDSLNKLAVGGVQQNLNAITIKKFKIALLPLPTQQKIASILSTYDTLIENNTKRIRLLEQMAENLYKEWFIRFRFPGYENVEMENGLPKGWKVEKVANWCRVFTGKKDVNQTKENGQYLFFSCSPNAYHSDEYIYDGKAILIAGNGSYTGRTRYYEGKFDLYQRTYAVVSDKEDDDFIFYLYNRFKFDFEPLHSGGTRGAAIPYIVMKDITRYTFLYNKEIVSLFIKHIKPMFKEIENLQAKSSHLTRQRDFLLPRLMSGKLKVMVR